MKKKFKLFASLASLCLSLGILCFGVYAATSVNYTATGSVSYTVSDVFVNVSSKLYRSTTNAVSTTTQVDEVVTALKADPSTATGVEETGYTGDTVETLVDGSVVSPGQEVTGEAKDIAINYGSYTAEGDTAYAYYLVVEIENLGNETIKAEVTNNIADASALNSYIPAVNNTNIAADQTVRLVIAFALIDPTVGITENGDFEFDIVISQGVISSLFEEKESYYDVNFEVEYPGYYYITMGEYQDAPIEWRLLSIDGGQTRYEYVAGQAATLEQTVVGKQCVFVLNTYIENYDIRFLSYGDKYGNYPSAGSEDDEINYPGIVWLNYYVLTEDNEFIALSEPDEDGKVEYALANNYLYSDIRNYLLNDAESDYNLLGNELYSKVVKNTTDGMNDNLWLLSKTEVETLFANICDSLFFAFRESNDARYWWTRSADPDNSGNCYHVGSDLFTHFYSYSTDAAYAVRPALKLQF